MGGLVEAADRDNALGTVALHALLELAGGQGEGLLPAGRAPALLPIFPVGNHGSLEPVRIVQKIQRVNPAGTKEPLSNSLMDELDRPLVLIQLNSHRTLMITETTDSLNLQFDHLIPSVPTR